MKNLNKKISSVVLASMVLFGGFAASGVQSFASSKGESLVVKKNLYNPDMEKLDDAVEKLDSRYHVIEGYGSLDSVEKAVLLQYSHYARFNSNIISVNDNNLSRRLKMFLKDKPDSFIVKYKGMWYAIGLKNLK